MSLNDLHAAAETGLFAGAGEYCTKVAGPPLDPVTRATIVSTRAERDADKQGGTGSIPWIRLSDS